MGFDRGSLVCELDPEVWAAHRELAGSLRASDGSGGGPARSFAGEAELAALVQDGLATLCDAGTPAP